MSNFVIDNLPVSEAGKRMLKRVSPIYSNSYVAKWLNQVMGSEWDEARELLLSLREQLFTETVTWGIEYQEHKYSITPDESLTLQERRSRLKRKKPRHLPISPGQLEKYIADGWGLNVNIDETYRAGHIKLTFDENATDFLRKDIITNFRRIKPSHLVILTELFFHLLDNLSIDEARNTIINIIKSTKEFYPWRGRYYDSSWTFTPQVIFDNSWLFDEQYKFDGIPIGEIDTVNNHFRFNGDWAFGINDSRFGYPISRKILWGADEPDELSVNLQSAIIDEYKTILPFNRLDNFDGKWQFGAREAPVDSEFYIHPKPILKENIALVESKDPITKITAILQDVYPLSRAKFFDGKWQFASAWLLGSDWLSKFGDVKFAPWNFAPLEFWGSDKNFCDNWCFNLLPPAEAFFSEDDAERLQLNYAGFSPEIMAPAEKDIAQVKIDLNDNILSEDTWGDKGIFKSFPNFGRGQICFQKPPDFIQELKFNASWAFGCAERFFNSDWSFGSADFCYSDDWRFGGEDYFESKQIKELSDTRINAQLTDCLEHEPIFANEEMSFDDSWQFGKPQNMCESMCIEIVMGLAFNNEWTFGVGARLFDDDSWQFGVDSYCYGENAKPKRVFNSTWAFAENIRFERRWNYFGQNRIPA